jgi:hypothetical protein
MLSGSSRSGLSSPEKPQTKIYSSNTLSVRAYETAGWSGLPSGLNWDELDSDSPYHFKNELIILSLQQSNSKSNK